MLSSIKVTKTHTSIGSHMRKNKYTIVMIMIDEQTDLDIHARVRHVPVKDLKSRSKMKIYILTKI
jgi:hypothetical protein